jgi:hypothetical protein
LNIVDRRFSYHEGKYAVEMERRKVSNLGNDFQFQRPVEMPVDVIHHPVDTRTVFYAAVFLYIHNLQK